MYDRHVWRAIWLSLFIAHTAHAEPTIVLVETRDAPQLPALASQVELHSSYRATIRTRSARDADALTYASTAAQLVASGEASLVVWLAPVDRGVLVFVAGRRVGRALVEHVLVDAALGPAEIERTIALKLAGLLDELLAPRATLKQVLAIVPTPERSAWRIELAGVIVRDAHQRATDGRARVSASRAWFRDAWFIAPALDMHWQPSGAMDSPRGRASITEVGTGLGLELGLRARSMELVLRPHFVSAILLARGAARDGRQGDATLVVPYLGSDAIVRAPVSDTMHLGVVAGIDYALVRNRLEIDGETAVDLGRLRFNVGFCLTVLL
jgi:hypothetical protein